MNTKALMAASALFMGCLGVAASFLPQEILTWIGAPSQGALPLLVQLGGALYVGFAMVNWMAKANLLGGIYNRAVAMGNFAHFFIGATVLIKGLLAGQRALGNLDRRRGLLGVRGLVRARRVRIAGESGLLRRTFYALLLVVFATAAPAQDRRPGAGSTRPGCRIPGRRHGDL